ncbi:MAG: DUF1844 domain-containing protein [Phycisphaerales bacterium]
MPDEDAPKLHIDSDWKASAQAEKAKLSEQEKAKAATRSAGNADQPPEASFTTLVDVLASQAVMGLGAVADPETGGVVIDPIGSKFAIDLMGVIEEKTKGNLSDEEQAHLKQLLAELRSRFIQIMELVKQQAATQRSGKAPTPGVPGNLGNAGILTDPGNIPPLS